MAREFARSFKYANATQGKVGNLVKITAAETVDLTAADSDVTFGILMNEPKQNETANLRMGEIGEIIKVAVDGSGTAIAVGDLLKAGANGLAVKAVKAGGYVATAKYVIGVATEACSVAGGVIGVQWRPFEMDI